eukprot:2013777-Pyramimonas_sp.AAC.1
MPRLRAFPKQVALGLVQTLRVQLEGQWLIHATAQRMAASSWMAQNWQREKSSGGPSVRQWSIPVYQIALCSASRS